MRHRIYLAARFSRRSEMRFHRDLLRSRGYLITSRWLDAHINNAEGKDSNLWERDHAQADPFRAICANEDLEDITRADYVIAFTEPPYCDYYPGTGGRHVELGYAIAKHKTIFIVGYRENVFHDLPCIHYCANVWSLLEHFPEL